MKFLILFILLFSNLSMAETYDIYRLKFDKAEQSSPLHFPIYEKEIPMDCILIFSSGDKFEATATFVRKEKKVVLVYNDYYISYIKNTSPLTFEDNSLVSRYSDPLINESAILYFRTDMQSGDIYFKEIYTNKYGVTRLGHGNCY